MDVQSARRTLEGLSAGGIGSMTDDICYFTQGDRLKAAVSMLESGSTDISIDEMAAILDWRDFEGLAAEILSAKNFAVMKNFRLRNPATEIDVIGIRMGIAMLIDCKHWKRTASLKTAVDKQIIRTRHYVTKTPGAIAVPVIVTLYKHAVEFINNVPIVPISGFSSFVDEFYGNLDMMKTIKTDS